MSKPTLFLVIDTETTKRNGLVFDAAWRMKDRKGTVYSSGSILFKDVLRIDDPFYKEKIADYWTLVFKGKIKPLTFGAGREVLLREIKKFKKEGYRVIFCAYNAVFDSTALSNTSQRMLDSKFFDAESAIEIMCLWHAFVSVVPMAYFQTCEISEKGNPRTNAENVYRYIIKNEQFVEKHIAHSDVLIEEVILSHVLKQKKKLPIYKSPKDIPGNIWKLAAIRGEKVVNERKEAMRGRPIA